MLLYKRLTQPHNANNHCIQTGPGSAPAAGTPHPTGRPCQSTGIIMHHCSCPRPRCPAAAVEPPQPHPSPFTTSAAEPSHVGARVPGCSSCTWPASMQLKALSRELSRPPEGPPASRRPSRQPCKHLNVALTAAVAQAPLTAPAQAPLEAAPGTCPCSSHGSMSSRGLGRLGGRSILSLGGKMGPAHSWKIFRLSMSLWVTLHLEQRANTLPVCHACGLIGFTLVLPQMLQVNLTCRGSRRGWHKNA